MVGVSGFFLNIPGLVRGLLGALLPVEKNLGREVTPLFSEGSLEKSVIRKLQTWQDNFPPRAVDAASLSWSVETRAECKIRWEYLDGELS